MTRRLAVLGKPIEHSKSPTIHNAAYRVLGLDWTYDRREIGKGGLRPFVESLDETWLGLSLTMPLKEEAARLATNLDDSAQLTGAANTLVRLADGWHGFNTDVYGIVQALRSAGVEHPQTVLILGSGATAKSALTAVREMNPDARVAIWARNPHSRKQLLDYGKSLGITTKAVRTPQRAMRKRDLTISTLPAHAMDDLASQLLQRGFQPAGSLLDVAYQPWPSEISKVWSRQGQVVIAGIEMLLWQAVAQIRIFKNGNPEAALAQEQTVLEAMRSASMWQN